MEYNKNNNQKRKRYLLLFNFISTFFSSGNDSIFLTSQSHTHHRSEIMHGAHQINMLSESFQNNIISYLNIYAIRLLSAGFYFQRYIFRVLRSKEELLLRRNNCSFSSLFYTIVLVFAEYYITIEHKSIVLVEKENHKAPLPFVK